MRAYHENRSENTVNDVYAWKDKNFKFSAHWHIQLEIAIVLSGNMQAQVNGKNYVMNEGDALICGSNDIHSYQESDGQILLIILSPSFIGNTSKVFQNSSLNHHCVRAADITEETKMIIDSIVTHYSNNKAIQDEAQLLIFRGYCMSLCGFLLSKLDYGAKEQSMKLKMHEHMRKALQFIEEHFCEDLNLEQVADIAGISRYYFSHCFKTYSGYGLTEFINMKRVQKAEEMIKDTHKSITEISMECGFGSVRNFNRVYKKIMGGVPQTLRVNSDAPQADEWD